MNLTIKNTASSLYSNISQLWKNSNDDQLLQNHKLLEIGRVMQSLSKNPNITIQKCEFPRLVVVGTQSSGKSSLLNRILSMDLLPTGKMMVTRTPLHLYLVQTSKNVKNGTIEFGEYNTTGEWHVNMEFSFKLPYPPSLMIQKIHKYIEQQTIQKAGSEKNISSIPIILKIYSPNIPNLNLIDLPGITMVACTDKGQPENIKQQIIELIQSYISDENTLILSVMAARPDLEADMALDVIKSVDPTNKRTIGVITKVDLMNQDTDIVHYLENKISKDLQLGYGYYAIKNRNSQQIKTVSILEAITLEKKYFSNHPKYSKCSHKNKFGIVNLGNNLSNILIHTIKDYIPDLLKTIHEELFHIDKELTKLGVNLNKNITTSLHTLLSEFSRIFITSLDDRNSDFNSGRMLKKLFIDYRNNILSIVPYKEVADYKQYLQECIENSEGNHMSYLSSPIDILEFCLRDKRYNPMNHILDDSIQCVKDVVTILHTLIDTILNQTQFSRFHKLVSKIKSEVCNTILQILQKKTIESIKRYIEIETNYIWTDDPEFKKAFDTILDNKLITLNPECMELLINAYYNTYKKTVQIVVPKIIMYDLVLQAKKNISNTLFDC